MNNSNLNTINILVKPLFMIGLIGVLILGLFKADKYLKIKAVDDCFKAATYSIETVKNEEQITTSSTEPIRALYKLCMADKGYETLMTE
ncbi:hypothetical protein HYT02_04240 [Candidatus Gottesmanbacteria bacterium]|nr:hypothetical protein [Candidatus Gottesmanbacteria bacterium]